MREFRAWLVGAASAVGGWPAGLDFLAVLGGLVAAATLAERILTNSDGRPTRDIHWS